MNESEFVQGLRSQDPAAVSHLTECYLPSVWRFVFARVGGDRHLAEDIVSETMLALVRAVKNETDLQNPGAWMRTVAHNKMQDHFRAAARVQHLVEQVKRQEDSVDRNEPGKHQEQLEQREEVRQAMDQLSEQHRITLEWKYLDKLSVRQIAERLELTEKAVESILFRARRELRSKLKRTDDPGGDRNPNCACETRAEDSVTRDQKGLPRPWSATEPS